jgi:hypothetical protein
LARRRTGPLPSLEQALQHRRAQQQRIGLPDDERRTRVRLQEQVPESREIVGGNVSREVVRRPFQ